MWCHSHREDSGSLFLLMYSSLSLEVWLLTWPCSVRLGPSSTLWLTPPHLGSLRLWHFLWRDSHLALAGVFPSVAWVLRSLVLPMVILLENSSTGLSGISEACLCHTGNKDDSGKLEPYGLPLPDCAGVSGWGDGPPSSVWTAWKLASSSQSSMACRTEPPAFLALLDLSNPWPS